MNLKWQKSTYSTPSGNCVEVASNGDNIFIRESDSPGEFVVTSKAKLAAFLAGAKDGEFDHFVK